MLKKAVLATILIALIFALTGCQTVEGFGKDIQWTSKKGAELISGE
jgi:predicted small secreted protein